MYCNKSEKSVKKYASKKVQQTSIPLAMSQKIGMFHKALKAVGEPE